MVVFARKIKFEILFLEGKVSKENMIEFMKMIKNTSDLNDEDASLIAASKAHDSMPKSRLYYRIEASRNIGGGKKVDPKSNMTDKLKVRDILLR